jgi:hypothetical protein
MLTRMDRIPIGKPPSGDEPDNVVPLRGSDEETEQAMSYEEALAADRDDPQPDDDEREPSVPGAGVAALVEQGMRVGAGMFSAGATAFAEALRASMPGRDEADDATPDPAATLTGAGLGAAVTAAEAAASAAADAADAMAPLLSWVLEPRFAREAGEMAAGATRVLDGQWKAAQAETVNAASSFLSALVPEIVQGVMDQVDLTALVRDRVDINAIVEDVDLDRIMDRVDVNAIVAKVDMERLAGTFPVDAIIDKVDVSEVIAKVDVNEVVDTVDIERIMERVDLTSIVDRLDLAAIAQEVIDEIDLPAIVRESSGAMASETVQTVRVRGMDADRLVARIVDKVLRREARNLDPPPEA